MLSHSQNFVLTETPAIANYSNGKKLSPHHLHILYAFKISEDEQFLFWENSSIKEGLITCYLNLVTEKYYFEHLHEQCN